MLLLLLLCTVIEFMPQQLQPMTPLPPTQVLILVKTAIDDGFEPL
jgi:hypothetical protein